MRGRAPPLGMQTLSVSTVECGRFLRESRVSITINVDRLSLCHRGSGGRIRNTIPDVCRSPSVPVPYSIMSFSRDLEQGSRTVFADGGHSIAIRGSRFSRCIGDEPGVGKGVASSTQLHEARWLTWSFTVFIEGRNACRLTDKMTMNKANCASLGGLDQPPLPPGSERVIICAAICICHATPGLSASGQRLRQQCVSNALRAADAMEGWQSTIKPEVAYNMTTQPPSPLMRSTPPTRPAYFPEWLGIARRDIPGFRQGQGQIRIPDVVVVNNGQLPPTQGNIRRIYEIKFPGDVDNEFARRSDVAIAGDPSKREVLTPRSCNCPEPQQQPVQVPELSWWDILALIAAGVLILTPIPGDEVLVGAGAAARLMQILRGARTAAPAAGF
jgi:hypothetical protein